jgi:hypothetical protein
LSVSIPFRRIARRIGLPQADSRFNLAGIKICKIITA